MTIENNFQSNPISAILSLTALSPFDDDSFGSQLITASEKTLNSFFCKANRRHGEEGKVRICKSSVLCQGRGCQFDILRNLLTTLYNDDKNFH